MRRAIISLSLVLALAVPAVAAAPTAKVTRNGVGPVKLGATHKKLRANDLVGPMVPGCEVAGPKERAAELQGDLSGVVEYTSKAPRRVRTVLIAGGAEAKGVGIGDRRADVERAFPGARVDESTEDVFGLTLVTVLRKEGGRFQFGIDTRDGKVTLIGVPGIPFCE